MRNDARPIGEDSPASPVGGDALPGESARHDGRDAHKDDRQSPVVNRGADERDSEAPDVPERPARSS